MTRQHRGQVLVVDDDIVVLEITRERLERAGFSVVTRTSALGTSAYIRKEKPAHVLLDVNMPGLSGDALAKLIVDGDFRTGVILHSSQERQALAALAQKCGALGVIEKTDDDEYFRAQLEGCFRSRPPGASRAPGSRNS
jgi:DNA-binding NtrC family response regulator